MSSTEAGTTAIAVRLRPPRASDGVSIHALVDHCKPLDLNSLYSYLLIGSHFSQTSVVAVDQEGIAGFISAYIPPETPDTLFVWQVAVHERMRGQRLAGRMIGEILRRDACRHVCFIDTTVTPSNIPSKRLFQGVARMLRAPITESPRYTVEHFGSANHEEEVLHRIGPFDTSHHNISGD